jgi:hypothetical protein
MATGGPDESTILDQDEDHQGIDGGESKVEKSGWDEEEDKDQEQGVGRRRKESKRNKGTGAAGILRIDTGSATGFHDGSRRKSSASSVGDFRVGANYLNPQVSRRLLFDFVKSQKILIAKK